MFDIKLKYMTSIFGDFSNIAPTPQQIAKLLLLFQDMELLPSIFKEIPIGSGTPQNRIQLASQGNEWTIFFPSGRIDVEKNSTDIKGKNIGELKDFIIKAQEIFKRISSEFDKKANRLALITQGFLKEMATEQLDSLYKKLFNPINFYKTRCPHEWNSRHAAKYPLKINSMDEEVNIITSIDRVRGRYLTPKEIAEFNRIQVQFDINTLQEKKDNRFDINSIIDFHNKALELRDEIIKELEEYLIG